MYTGKYYCLVAECEFETLVIGEQAGAGRVTMVAHGLSAHGLDWNTVGNQEFLPPPADPLAALGEPDTF